MPGLVQFAVLYCGVIAAVVLAIVARDVWSRWQQRRRFTAYVNRGVERLSLYVAARDTVRR